MSTSIKKNTWSTDAHISPSVFDSLVEMSKKHKCALSDLVSICVASQLSRWSPSLRKSMTALFGETSSSALDALVMDGWISSSLESLCPPSSSEFTSAAESFSTPVDALALAWETLTSIPIPSLLRRRLHSQVAKYSTPPSRNPELAARLHLWLFPSSSFNNLVHDSYHYGSSIDAATSVYKSIGPELLPGVLSKWQSILEISAKAQGKSAVEDPYIFVPPASSPRFDIKVFSSLVKNYSVRDAISLSSSSLKTKTPPNPEALIYIQD